MSEGDGGEGTEAILLGELGRVVEPLARASGFGRDGVVALLDELRVGEALVGDDVDKIVSIVDGEIADPIDAITTALEGDLDPGAIDDLVTAIGRLVAGVDSLSELEFREPAATDLGETILDYLLVTYLRTYHRDVHDLFVLLDVVRAPPDGPPELDLGRIVDVLGDPTTELPAAIEWGSEQFRPFVVVYYLKQICWGLGISGSLEGSATDEIFGLLGGTPGRSEDGAPATTVEGLDGVDSLDVTDAELRLPMLEVESVSTGIRIVPLPGRNGALPGLAIVPYGALDDDGEWDLGDGWTFNLAVSGSLADQAFAVRPTDSGATAERVSLDGSERPGEVHGEADLARESTDGADETVLFGDPDGSRLAVNHVAGRATLDYDDGELVIKVAVPARGTMGVHPDDFDGFLASVLPGDGLFYDFEVTVGWSSRDGLFFERGGTLEASIPQDVDLGPFTLREVYLAALADGDDADDASGGDLSLVGAASGDVELGPIVGTVSRMGLSADVSFPEAKDGSLGIVDLDVGFEPPEGIGLSIDAGAVTGGGYLEFEPEKERYAGTLQLQAGSLSIDAVGLLTTRLPDGSDGFSLLVLIAGQFDPVQLGFGFTLNGVGGLLGINRSVKAKPLGQAVRSGSLDSVLFPQDPVANAQRIVSDLRSVFPPTAGAHVFGPMARLGWGTPTLVTADLGIVLELPSGKLVLLGALHATLPDEAAPLIELHMGLSGVFDPANERAAVDASLYDSRIVQWTVSGDMAMRSNWGENPRFVLAVGGFNPRFDPPDDFPELDRVTASLGAPGGNPKLEFTGYFALTSNTVQAGAGVHLQAKAGPAKVEGTLAFDALFQFDPFEFVVDFLAKLSVKVKGKGLSLKLDGTLWGPSPWRVKGTLRIEILFFEITIRVDVSVGSAAGSAALPRARVFPKLLAELEKPSNWAAQLPDDGEAVATFRETDEGAAGRAGARAGGEETDGTGEDDGDAVLAHPTGTIGVRQTVVPLAYEIERFGNARPTGYTRFEIDAAGDGIRLGADLYERFAPAQYLDLSDAEKLESPAFERQRAGRRMRHPGVYPGYRSADQRAENVVSTELGYECSVVDRPNGNWGTPLAELGKFRSRGLNPLSGLPTAVTDALAEAGAVATGDLRVGGGDRFRLSEDGRRQLVAETGGLATEFAIDEPAAATNPDEDGLSGAVAVGEPTYTVVRADDLSEAGLVEGEVSKAAARRALSNHVADSPGAAGAFQVVESHRARAGAAATAATALADGGEDDSRDGGEGGPRADGDADDATGTGSRAADERGPEVYL